MAKLSKQEKKAIENALDFIQKIIDCYNAIAKKNQSIKQKEVGDIKKIKDSLKKLNKEGKIDWKTKRFTVTASTDSKGIHLNDKWGNNYKNDYDLPADYKLDDCKKGKFYYLWRITEILIHEYYHYDNHTGFFGSLNKVWQVTAMGVGGFMVEGVSSILGKRSKLRRKYVGHEHKTYSHTNFILGRLGFMLTDIFMHNADCLPCVYEHIKQANSATKRQEPYK